MRNYVVGFYFANKGRNVLLIEKKKPEWQRGKINGIGGHIEIGESPLRAMVREFEEETGHSVPSEEWRDVTALCGKIAGGEEWFRLYAFAALGEVIEAGVETDEGTTGWYKMWDDVPNGPYECIWNLRWLLPLSLELLNRPRWFISNAYSLFR